MDLQYTLYYKDFRGASHAGQFYNDTVKTDTCCVTSHNKGDEFNEYFRKQLNQDIPSRTETTS